MGSSDGDSKRKKEVESVAKHMRFTITTKKAIIKGENIEYFPGDMYKLCAQLLSCQTFFYREGIIISSAR